jgi:protein-tyrosine-phosphatase
MIINEKILNYLEKSQDYATISNERKEKLEKLSDYIREKSSNNEIIQLNFICTHNSRRSHVAQIWAAVAAEYYGISNVVTFSGGTEATAFNINAVNSMRRSGFDINIEKDGKNPVYKVSFGNESNIITAFSKVYDKFNPSVNFAAIMVCSDADEACPYVPGTDARFALPFEDPKPFDGTDLETQKYDERTRQIATEIMYVFSKI